MLPVAKDLYGSPGIFLVHDDLCPAPRAERFHRPSGLAEAFKPFSHVHPGVPAAVAGELAAGIHTGISALKEGKGVACRE